jgi:hypothetical protein
MFRRNGVWQFSRRVNGKREVFSLRTSDLGLAKAKRDAYLQARTEEERDRVLGRERRAVATLGAIVAAVLAADYPRARTRRGYANCLLLVVARATGKPRAEVERLPASVLTLALVQDYQDAVMQAARARGADERTLARAKFSANRILAQARACFANERPLRALTLPDLAGFRKADNIPVTVGNDFTPLTVAEAALLDGAAREIRASAPGIYLAYLLMRRLGLRNEEVLFLKPADAIRLQADGTAEITIALRPYYVPKGRGSHRTLTLPAAETADVLALAAGREWLLPGDSPTARRELTHRGLNAWLAEVYATARAAGRLPAGTPTRTAYDLRKQAGSEYYAQTGSLDATSLWLGHESSATTMRWYVKLIHKLPALTAPDSR